MEDERKRLGKQLNFNKLENSDNSLTLKGMCLFKGCHLFRINFDPHERMP